MPYLYLTRWLGIYVATSFRRSIGVFPFLLCLAFFAGCSGNQETDSVAADNRSKTAELLHQTVLEARVLESSELEQLPSMLEPRVTKISVAQIDAIKHLANSEGESDAPKEVLQSLVETDSNKIPVMDLTLVLIDLDLADEFSEHSDPIVRFIANYYLTKSGRIDAAGRLHSLIHEPQANHLDARYLKTRFVAMGIDLENDDEDSIAKYLSGIDREFPVHKAGDSLPNFRFVDTHGDSFDIKELGGKRVVIHFWATWCGPCMEELDDLAERLARLNSDNFEVVFVSLDFDLDAHNDCIAQLPKRFRYVCDGKSARGPITSTFSVSHIPCNVVVSSRGTFESSNLTEYLPELQRTAN